jgi:hypothetical protein
VEGKRYFAAFEVLTAAFVKSSIFWDMTPDVSEEHMTYVFGFGE